MVGDDVGKLVEPERRDAVENFSLEGNLIGKNKVECRDAVGSDHQQAIARIVNIADLTMRIGTTLHRTHVSQLLIR